MLVPKNHSLLLTSRKPSNGWRLSAIKDRKGNEAIGYRQNEDVQPPTLPSHYIKPH